MVADQLTETLQKISRGKLDPRAPARIQAVALELGILALKMGSQRAHIMLDVAQSGEMVQCGTGSRFKDGGGEGSMGMTGEVTVDLTTQPCLRKIGNGRDDAKTENIIVRGEVVAYET